MIVCPRVWSSWVGKRGRWEYWWLFVVVIDYDGNQQLQAFVWSSKKIPAYFSHLNVSLISLVHCNQTLLSFGVAVGSDGKCNSKWYVTEAGILIFFSSRSYTILAAKYFLILERDITLNLLLRIKCKISCMLDSPHPQTHFFLLESLFVIASEALQSTAAHLNAWYRQVTALQTDCINSPTC